LEVSTGGNEMVMKHQESMEQKLLKSFVGVNPTNDRIY